jgi:hypothetical protein
MARNVGHLSGLRHSAHAFGAAQRRSEFEQMIHNLIIKVCHQINREQDGAKRMKQLDDFVSLLRKEQAAIKQKIDSEMRKVRVIIMRNFCATARICVIQAGIRPVRTFSL